MRRNPPSLHRRESVQDGFVRIMQGLVEHAIQTIESPGVDRSEDLHQVRVVLKRLRAFLRLFRPVLDRDVYDLESRHLRAAAQQLSPFRDTSVTLDTLKQWQHRVRQPEEQQLLVEVQQTFEEKLAPAHLLGQSREVALRRTAATLRAFGGRLGDLRLKKEDWEALEPGLLGSYRRARLAMKRAFAREREEDFHEWRKRSKDLVYHLQLLEPAWAKKLHELVRQLNRLQEMIGRDHDLVVVTGFLDLDAMRATPEGAERVNQQLLKECARIRKRCAKLGRKTFDRRPSCFIKTMRKHWQAWRKPVAPSSRGSEPATPASHRLFAPVESS